MKTAELIEILQRHPDDSYVAINLNREEPNPNWLIEIDTVYGYIDSMGDYVVELSAEDEIDNKLSNALDWIWEHVHTFDDYASALRHIGYTRAEAGIELMKVVEDENSVEESLLWGYDKEEE